MPATSTMALSAPVVRERLPSPRALAALGTVLCLYRGGDGGELSGWTRATTAEASTLIDSDGMRECLLFRDAAGDCSWKLYLLPDSDFLAWERLSTGLPTCATRDAGTGGIAERLLQRIANRARGGAWQASVLRLRVASTGPRATDGRVLGANLASVSPLGATIARAVARSEGADVEALRDDCCCARAARLAGTVARHRHDDSPTPIVRLRSPGLD